MRHCSGTNLIPLFGYYHLVNGSDGAMGHGAEMNGCGKCLKYLMFTFNLLSLVSCTVSLFICIRYQFLEHGCSGGTKKIQVLSSDREVKMGPITRRLSILIYKE
jgi:hypothetical protein